MAYLGREVNRVSRHSKIVVVAILLTILNSLRCVLQLTDVLLLSELVIHAYSVSLLTLQVVLLTFLASFLCVTGVLCHSVPEVEFRNVDIGLAVDVDVAIEKHKLRY